jgi:hypothetical protein
VNPGESPAIFGDSLRRLASVSTFLYQDGPRSWYSTQPTVTKLADDRAEQLRRDPDKVVHELEQRLRKELQKAGDFSRVHPMPRTAADVPDDLGARLVVLGVDHPYSKESGNPAEKFAKTMLESRGNTPRLFRNTLVFLAADKVRLQDLDEAVRKYLAWDSILAEKDTLNLDPHQVKSAESQIAAANSVVTSRLPEVYQWLLVPGQKDTKSGIEWQAIRLTGSDSLAVRASKKLKNDELLIINFAASRLKMELDRIPLWRGDHVAVKQLIDDFARYTYLPRLQGPHVIVDSIRNGVEFLTWQQDAFAYADNIDEKAGRYRGLRGGQTLSIFDQETTGLLVRSEIARKQMDAESVQIGTSESVTKTDSPRQGETQTEGKEKGVKDQQPVDRMPKRFHGTVQLDAARVGRDASRVADEVISHLTGLVGAKVTINLEIDALMPGGANEMIVRTVTENGKTLKFSSQGFEND